MALKFNTFRARRYLRSKFIEGKFLLASEATDLELELMDQLRELVKNTLGDVALADAWKVEKLSETEILIKPGEAWFKGLPFSMRGGKDQLVSGAVVSLGTAPVGVSISDNASGLGKILTFGTVGTPNGGSVTPTNTYRIVVTAKEELITEVQDQFLQNANLTESTQQKIRLVFQINVVPESLQTESPIPYRDENSTGLSGITNFPDSGNSNDPNFINRIVVTPSLGSGDLLSSSVITGAEIIDGRDLELTISNPTGSNPIPNSPATQAAFSHGTLIDSIGNKFHINLVTNAPVSGQVVIRIDKEYQQEDPQILIGQPYILERRDIYVTDDVNGVPQGKLHWPIATIDWDSTDGVAHESKITDLRTSVDKLADYEAIINQKTNLKITDGGTISYNNTTSIATWSAPITIINPHGLDQTIAAASVPIVDGGSLMYDLKLDAGGPLQKGTVAVNVTTAGLTSVLSAVVLSSVRVGNIIVDSLGTVAEITSINDVNNTITTNIALAATGAATIYLDSFGPGTAPLSSDKFVLATRKGSKIYIAGLELEDGESSQIGDGASQELLAFIGSTGDSDNSPQYTSNFYVVNGTSLVDAISALDTALDGLSSTVAAISWKAPVANKASLPPTGNTDGDVRLTLDTRVAYSWDGTNSVWKPLNGIGGGGVKIIGGGTISVSGTTLTFTSDMYLELKGLSYFDNTIPTSQSPISFPNNLDVAYVIPNTNSGGPNLSVTVDTLSQVPVDAVIIARRDGSDIIVGSSSTRLKNGQSTQLYAQDSNQTLAYIGATDTADEEPTFSSDIRGTANEDLTSRSGVLTDVIGDYQEDRSMYLRSDNPITWTGTQLEFTSDIVLEVVNTKSGTVKTATILASASPIVFNNGESAWVSINRTLASENLTVNLSGVTSIPAQSQANKDVIIIGRRQDVLSVGYLHLPLHKQVLEPGQTVRLGASGSGGNAISEEVLNLRTIHSESPYIFLASSIFLVDENDFVDSVNTTATFSIVDSLYELAIGEVITLQNILDPSYDSSIHVLQDVGVVIFFEGTPDTGGTAEVSLDGGTNWSPVTLEQNNDAPQLHGEVNFATIPSSPNIKFRFTASVASKITGIGILYGNEYGSVITPVQERIVGSLAEVNAGIALFTQISEAIASLGSGGGKIRLLSGTFVENVTINSDNVLIEGSGWSSKIQGDVIINGDYNILSKLTVEGNIENNGDNNEFDIIWDV